MLLRREKKGCRRTFPGLMFARGRLTGFQFSWNSLVDGRAGKL